MKRKVPSLLSADDGAVDNLITVGTGADFDHATALFVDFLALGIGALHTLGF